MVEVPSLSKKYHVELDVIASAGVDGVTRLASDDNTVYINRAALEHAASDRKNPFHQEYLEFLNWKNDLEAKSSNTDLDNKMLRTPAGGYISWDSPAEGVIYVTRDPVRRSQLLGERKNVDFPHMLRFTTEPLKSGKIDIDYFNKDDPTPKDVMTLAEVDELFPYQFVSTDRGGRIYAVKRNLKEIGHRKSRFELDDKVALKRLKFNSEDGKIYRLPETVLPHLTAWNLEQRLAWDQITSPDIELSFLTGGSGSGKTVLAYGAALQMILDTRNVHGNQVRFPNRKPYDGIVLFKTNDIIGGENRAFGFLKGDLKEKSWPFMKSYKDAHELSGAGRTGVSFEQMLMHPSHGNDFSSNLRLPDLQIGGFLLPQHREAIEVEHLQFARGRTFNNRFIIVDEAQNYTPNEMKQLLERVGEGSKVLILGDPMQVDGERFGLSPDFNGLVWAANTHFGNHPRVSFMDLDKNYRSQTAEITREKKAPRTLI